MRIIVAILYTLYSILYTSIIVRAESLSVSLQVGSTEVIFSGYTSPNSFVVIKEGIDVVGTTTSNGNGDWSATINVAIPDIHTYTIYSTDSLARQTSSVDYTLNVAGNTSTALDHIVIPPTTSLASSIISGSTHPTATITLTISSGDSASINPDLSGNWNYDLSSIAGGPHTITATASVPPSYLSIESTALYYTAASPSPSPHSEAETPSEVHQNNQDEVGHSPSPLASTSPLPSPTPRPFFIAIYDLNNDGSITKSELIDVIKAWLQKFLICDLNNDQKCNLIDLSILLYYIDR